MCAAKQSDTDGACGSGTGPPPPLAATASASASASPMSSVPTPAVREEPDYFQLSPSQQTSSGSSPRIAPTNEVWARMLSTKALSTPLAGSAAMPADMGGMPSFPLPSTLLPPHAKRRPAPAHSVQHAGGSARASAVPPDASRYVALDPPTLVDLLHKRSVLDRPIPEHILVLDIRPTTAFHRTHLRGSTNVCAPTTLLRRAEFTIERLEEQILVDGPDKEAFQRWRTYAAAPSRTSWVVVLDTDSKTPTSIGRSSAGGGGPSLVGLLRKFDDAGYQGTLAWVRGGFQAVAMHPSAAPLLESEAGAKGTVSATSMPHAMRSRGLTLEAFQRSSTVDRDSHGDELQATNPFFDNIRQNLELSCGITDVVPLNLDLDASQLARLPQFMRDLFAMDTHARACHLAEQFFEVEKREQTRLQKVMQRHAQESSTVGAGGKPVDVPVSDRAVFPAEAKVEALPPGYFALSITAALERGHDHRYRNIWPFEHSRVKFQSTASGAEYINASYVNPMRAWGAHRVYIATQAPLPTTFGAFWGVVWEHKVRAIVMVAREHESGRVQCDNYWHAPLAGPFDVRVVSERTMSLSDEGGDAAESSSPRPAPAPAPVLVRRVLEVRHKDMPAEPVHTVQQFQFLSWPDHSVPESPDSLLAMMRFVHDETDAGAPVPIVVHCSAGIGRTGTHILVDSVRLFLHSVRQVLESGADAPHLTVDQARAAWDAPTNLLFEALMVMREQRMNMVETVRQYVFAHKAVVASLLHTPRSAAAAAVP